MGAMFSLVLTWVAPAWVAMEYVEKEMANSRLDRQVCG